MLLHIKGKACKIQICAPSNCAVDEILTRVKDRGLVGYTTEASEITKLVVRVGAAEYEPNDHIKNLTLDSRVRELVVAEKIEKLEE
jgi:hypothetical protein